MQRLKLRTRVIKQPKELRQFYITSKVDSHYWNQNYKCLVVNLLPLPEFHIDAIVYDKNGCVLDDVTVVVTKADLVPKTDWGLEFAHEMSAWKPTEFGETLNLAVHMGDFDEK